MNMAGREESWDQLKNKFKQEYEGLRKIKQNAVLEYLQEKLGKSKEELKRAIRNL